MAFTLDQIKQYSKNPTSIPAPGKYGEGQVVNIRDMLATLKASVQNGSLNVTDYQALASPLVQKGYQASTAIGGGGSKAAGSLGTSWQDIVNGGYATARGGNYVATLPFSQQEYAKLDNSVLPTQTDVQKGLFDPTTAPLSRLQTPAGGSTTNGSSGYTPPTSVPNAPGGNPLPQINPGVLPGVDLRTDQGQIAYTGQQNAGLLQDVLNKQYDVNKQAVSGLQQGLSGIPGIFQQEGQNQQNQLNALADSQKSARAQSLTDLASTLATNQMNQFNKAIPDLAEQANTAGIYRSTGFGNILAQKYANLTADTQNQLALQGITDRNTYLNAQSNALNTQLGYSGQGANAAANNAQNVAGAGASALQSYGSGLSDVANTAIGANNAGLQRQFSLQDFLTQQNAAQQLANSAKTQGPTGKNSPGTQAWVQGSLAAVQTGGQLAGKGGAPKPPGGGGNMYSGPVTM